MTTVITNHVEGAGKVVGVHGGSGPMAWLRAATGSHLYGDWDGIEWVAFEPGGRAGLHTHSHTEEMWFILRGTADVELDGSTYPVSPGSIVLTPLGSSHSAQNTGDTSLEYVVIEVFPPAIRDALPRRRPTDETSPPAPPGTTARTAPPGSERPGGLVTQLVGDATLDPRPYLDGSWHTFWRPTIAEGHRFALPTAEQEHAIFVMAGDAVLTGRSIAETEVRAGSVITIGLGAEVVLTAQQPAELFITTLSVTA